MSRRPADFCTYFDHNYLTRGLALYESLRAHCPSFRLWVLCLDNESRVVLERLSLPSLHIVPLSELEAHDRDLAGVKDRRSAIEYYFTCSPCFPRYLLTQANDIQLLTYLDADLFFFADPEPVFKEIGSQSVAIVGHRFPERLRHLERFGRFNVGWISYRRDAHALACLDRWRGDCLAWCHDYVEDGKFADQAYLDAWPQQGTHIAVLEHKGVNVAPWNVENYQVQLSGGRIFVDGQPLVAFHFHGLREMRARIYDTSLASYGVLPSNVLTRHVYAPYVSALERIEREVPAHDAGSARYGRVPPTGWRQQVRFWRDVVSGRYLVVLNGRVVSAGR